MNQRESVARPAGAGKGEKKKVYLWAKKPPYRFKERPHTNGGKEFD